MKRNVNILSAFGIVLSSFVAGIFLVGCVGKPADEGVVVAQYRQIDSLKDLLEMDKQLIIRLASRIDSLEKASKLAVTKRVASNSTPKKSPDKKNTGNSVVVYDDNELVFFNTYVENEADMDL